MISYNKACILSLWQTQILISFLCLSSSHLSLHHYTYTQLSVFGFTWTQEESWPFLCSMYTVFMYVYFLQEVFLFYQSAFFISSPSLNQCGWGVRDNAGSAWLFPAPFYPSLCFSHFSLWFLNFSVMCPASKAKNSLSPQPTIFIRQYTTTGKATSKTNPSCVGEIKVRRV